MTCSARPSAPREFILESRLGSGSFASVWVAMHVNLRKKVAIKIISKHSVRSPKTRLRFEREAAIHKEIQHPHIASLFSVTENILNYYLVMEYIPGGSLHQKIATTGRLTEMEAHHYFVQILSALNYLHNEKHIAHRDLKADNIVIDQNNNIRLIDFGFSKYFQNENDPLTTLCGSPRYAAPEMYNKKGYTENVDMWSLGIVLYVCVVGRFPFDHKNFVLLAEKIKNDEPAYPSYLSKEITNLIRGLLEKDPSKRLTCQQALEQPWVTNRTEKVVNEYRDEMFDENDDLLNKITKRENLTLKIAGESPIENMHSSYLTRKNGSMVLTREGNHEIEYQSIVEKLCASGKFKPKPKTSECNENATLSFTTSSSFTNADSNSHSPPHAPPLPAARHRTRSTQVPVFTVPPKPPQETMQKRHFRTMSEASRY